MEQLRKEFENEVRAVFIAEYKEYEDVDDLVEVYVSVITKHILVKNWGVVL